MSERTMAMHSTNYYTINLNSAGARHLSQMLMIIMLQAAAVLEVLLAI